MPHLGVPELVLILVIVVAVFGAGKLANIGGALGKGVKDFRKSIRDEDDHSAPQAESAPAPQVMSAPQPAAPQPAVAPEAQASTEPTGGEQSAQ